MLMDKFIKSSPNSKIVVSVSAIAVVTLMAYGWIVSPQISYLHAAQQHKAMNLNAEQKTVGLRNQKKKCQAELSELQKQIEAIRDSFFTPTEAQEFFTNLDMVAMRCGCKVSSLTFASTKAVTPQEGREYFSSVTLKRAEVTLTGNYDGILEFLKKLGEYPHRISIASLLIKPNPGIVEELELVCSMTITIYIIENKETMSDE